MANEWVNTDGEACYDSIQEGFTLSQQNVMTIGNLYYLSVTVSGMTQGKLTIPTIDDPTEITEDGTYSIIGLALFTDLVFLPGSYLGGVFDGCIDIVELRHAPLYRIKTIEGVTVFTLSDNTGVTTAGPYIQYQIDWSDLDEGCYYIEFEDTTLTYRSDCFALKLTHDCTLQLTWNCNENAWGFNYADLSFTQSMRVDAKLWKSRHKALEKQVYEYSTGDLEILYVTKAKEFLLSVREIPEYMHDAFSLAVDSDNFFIDGIKYVFPDEETTPSWRNSSDLAPIEITLRRSQNLRNVNCG